jgi:hypothetical protein
MTHFTALRYGSREGALAEIARRLGSEVRAITSAGMSGPNQTRPVVRVAQGD